ncbi:hypothetical protein C9374_010109 [Naegleria lovaniensis]|uniref:Uncharacterized protein n=1 Tax=Naegleria lovaniensis TaxID=51637 RepID=A0AA88GCN6_NAELO|nr:uncharacterized protein C9374_010109 [Naegleria lovaniensis]KAG2375105.1 hypothetical protein C9374_010109 [Naegleria lovaniensis]
MFLTELLYSIKYNPSLKLKLSIIFFGALGFLDCITSLPIGLYGILVGGLNSPNADEQHDQCRHELLLNLIIGLGFLDMIGATLSLSFGSVLTIMTYKFFYDSNPNENDDQSVSEYGHFNQEPSDSIESVESNPHHHQDQHNNDQQEIEAQEKKLELLMKANNRLSARLHNTLFYLAVTRALFSVVFFVLACVVSEMIFQMSDSCARDNPFLRDTAATYMILRWIVYVFSVILALPLSVGFWNLILKNSDSLLMKMIGKELRKCKHGIWNLISRMRNRGGSSGSENSREQYFTTNQYHNSDL